MATLTQIPPNAELVAQAWIAAYAGIAPSSIAGSLPKVEAWANNSFVQVRALDAGNPNPELSELRRSVVRIDVWAAKPASARPLWNVAQAVMERIRYATFRNGQAYGKRVPSPISGYLDARVLSAYLINEPVRVEGDPSSYARVTASLAVDWTV
jgi:hypothetical protein